MKTTVTIDFYGETGLVLVKAGLVTVKKEIMLSPSKSIAYDGLKRKTKHDHIDILKRVFAVLEKINTLKPYCIVDQALVREKNLFTDDVYFWYYTIVFPLMPMVMMYKDHTIKPWLKAEIELTVHPIRGGWYLWKILRKFSKS